MFMRLYRMVLVLLPPHKFPVNAMLCCSNVEVLGSFMSVVAVCMKQAARTLSQNHVALYTMHSSSKVAELKLQTHHSLWHRQV